MRKATLDEPRLFPVLHRAFYDWNEINLKLDENGTLLISGVDPAKTMTGKLEIPECAAQGNVTELAVPAPYFSKLMAGSGRDESKLISLDFPSNKNSLIFSNRTPATTVKARVGGLAELAKVPKAYQSGDSFSYTTQNPETIRSAYLYFKDIGSHDDDALEIGNKYQDLRLYDPKAKLEFLCKSGSGKGNAESGIIRSLLDEATRVSDLDAVQAVQVVIPEKGQIAFHYDLIRGNLAYYVAAAIQEG